MVGWLPVASSRTALIWGVGTAGALAWLGSGFVTRTEARRLLLPGTTTAGHYQIELACEACHTNAFGGREALQAACVGCHGDDLDLAKDSHPETKFTDPRNADRVAVLDARYCVTCHTEHQDERTLDAGLTQPADYCVHCHADIAEERTSHQGMTFDSCAATGCHNYHDNRALYEDFLVKHAQEPATRASEIPPRPHEAPHASGPLDRTAARPFADHPLPEAELVAWERSGHARQRVGCGDCHGRPEDFVARPGTAACEGCHEDQVTTWQTGRHGMRAVQDLPPLQVQEARGPMHGAARGRSPDCQACHGSHGYDTRFAASDACSGCHDDAHTRAYASSRHAALFAEERAGRAADGSGVSCATCHLPRATAANGQVHVVHDQNRNLRPREKMLREVCMGCHSLAFSIDALADDALVRRNFSGRPARHVTSIDLALARSEPP